MPYSVWPSATTRAIPTIGGSVAQPDVGALALAGRAPTISSGTLSFSTTFSATENPLSEGGVWRHTTTTWQKPQSGSGLAYAGGVNNSYDDSYAYLSGFGNDYEIEATINLAGGYSPTNPHEVELLLRVSEPDTTHLKAYECLLGISGSSAYVQIFKWDGVMGADYFTEITGPNPTAIMPQNGDKVRARIVGSTINFWLVRGGTPSLMATASDSSHATGQPGISFFMRTGGTATSYCYTDCLVTGL